MSKQQHYDILVIGGGASGTALLYTLARYTNVSSVALVEKYATLGQVNSNAKNNSQTLHVGDIETNYTIDKVRQVKPAAMMVARYAEALPEAERAGIVTKVHKMVLAVGAKEVVTLEKRYADLKPLFPEITKLSGLEIAECEPAVMRGRSPDEPVLALANNEGYAVNFGALAESFVSQAKKVTDKIVDVFLGRSVTRISKNADGIFEVETSAGTLSPQPPLWWTLMPTALALPKRWAMAMNIRSFRLLVLFIFPRIYFVAKCIRCKSRNCRLQRHMVTRM